MQQTPCHEWHVSHGGRMVDFAGWDMPVQYSTIVEEHRAVREAAGLFDIAHMGRLFFRGPDAARFLDSIVTNDVSAIEIGQVRYALVTNETGGILDDVLVYRLPKCHLLVVNASNRVKIVNWIEVHRGGFDVAVEEGTAAHFMLAIQGPKAVEILSPHVDTDIARLDYYTVTEADVLGSAGLVSRTGYTGEDGFEVIIPAERALEFWETLIAGGAGRGMRPAGLGSRDTLRLEAAMPLYGHELTEQIDPYTAGVGFGVKLSAGDFIGKSALVAAKADKNRRRRVGLELAGKRIAREGAEVFVGGVPVGGVPVGGVPIGGVPIGEVPIGEVTSGTFSPTLQKPIAMGYVEVAHARVGGVVEVDIRGKRVAASVVKLPFYKRK